MSATDIFLSAINSPLCRFHLSGAPGKTRQEKRDRLGRARANAIGDPSQPGPWSLSIHYAATGYRDQQAGQAGDCDFFHNLLSLFLFPLGFLVNRRFRFCLTSSLDSAVQVATGKGQNGDCDTSTIFSRSKRV
jgi:hypothetical protein